MRRGPEDPSKITHTVLFRIGEGVLHAGNLLHVGLQVRFTMCQLFVESLDHHRLFTDHLRLLVELSNEFGIGGWNDRILE